MVFDITEVLLEECMCISINHQIMGKNTLPRERKIMLLSNALVKKSELQKEKKLLMDRIDKVLRTDKEDEPIEDINLLIDLLEKVVDELAELIMQIHHTNHRTYLEEGMTLDDAIILREKHSRQVGIYRSIAKGTTQIKDRWVPYYNNYARFISPTEFHKKADEYACKYAELNTRIQQKNWETKLIED